MPGDRMSVPVVVRAAGPKFETDTAEHLLRRICLPGRRTVCIWTAAAMLSG